MATEQKLRKLFVSHHHTDAAALRRLKAKLELWGSCFLAHEDIEPGEHDLERIEREVKSCDLFLYVASEEANSSEYCQQEIGMARGLEKKIFTAMKAGVRLPGFIARIQAIRYESIDDGFCDRIYAQCIAVSPASGVRQLPGIRKRPTVRQHLARLGVRGFSAFRREDSIFLESYPYRTDDLYRTTFRIMIRNRYTDYFVNIGYLGQSVSDDTAHELADYFDLNLPDDYFTHLELPFFSRLYAFHVPSTAGQVPITLSEEQVDSLRHLLNDETTMPEDQLQLISREEVYQRSISQDIVG